jgi:hypothetical protein
VNVIFLVLMVAVPALRAMIVSDRADKVALVATMLLFGCAALSCLWLIDAAFPYTEIGDDPAYFRASVRTLDGIGDWFNLQQFQETHTQAGYPLLLTWVNQFCGPSLYDRKALNLGIFLLLVPVWYVIGREIGGRRLAFACALAILLCTPLWFYCMFLLKDMVIVFLQSLLLLGLVQVLSGARGARGYGTIALSTILIIPFRSFLALMNGAMLVVASLLSSQGTRKSSRLGRIIITCFLLGALFAVGRDPAMMQTLGVHDETGAHTFSSNSLDAQLAEQSARRTTNYSNPAWFMLIYLVGEIGAFNPKSWGTLNTDEIRAITMIPWIYFGLPLFLVGARSIIFKRQNRPSASTASDVRQASQTAGIGNPNRPCLLLLMAFVVAYALISWMISDTTRWRMPTMPPMVAISAFAWCSMKSSERFLLLASWGGLLSVALVAYYMLVK